MIQVAAVNPCVAAPPRVVVGVVSDTHGHLYPRVVALLQGVDHIIHAGDIGSPQVLAALQAIAPVTAVRGNCDLEDWARTIPVQAELELGGVRICIRHIAGTLSASPGRPAVQCGPDPSWVDRPQGACDVFITGHSHIASMQERDGVLHLNPGSAGPRRFQRPRTVARMVIPVAAADERAGGSTPRALRPQIAVEIIDAEEPGH